jgi:hypothetical protein
MRWLDGASYSGEWRDNVVFGMGRFTHADGDIYEGNWAYD